MVAERFRSTSIQAVFTSKILRAQLTAREIAAAAEVDHVIVECLKERKVVYADKRTYSHEEAFEDLSLRLVEAKNFLENVVEERIVIVSHALFLRALMGRILFGELLTEELLQRMTEVFILDHAAVSKFEYNKEKNKWHIHYLNDRRHLEV